MYLYSSLCIYTYVYMLTCIEIVFGKNSEGGYVLRCVSTPLGRVFWNQYAFACMEETIVMLACIPCTKSNSIRVNYLDSIYENHMPKYLN